MIRPLLLTTLLLGTTQLPLRAMQPQVLVEEEFCTTCQYEITENVFTLSCGHKLHKSCLERQFKTVEDPAKITCSQCRKPISWLDRKKLNLSDKPEESLEKVHELLIYQLTGNNFGKFKEALATVANSTDFEELLGKQDEQLPAFIGNLTLPIAQDYDELSVPHVTMQDIILFITNIVDQFNLTSEDVIELREAIGRTGEKGRILLQILGPFFDEAEKLVAALNNSHFILCKKSTARNKSLI